MKKTLARGPLSRTLTLGGGRSCPVKFLNEIGRYIQKFILNNYCICCNAASLTNAIFAYPLCILLKSQDTNRIKIDI